MAVTALRRVPSLGWAVGVVALVLVSTSCGEDEAVSDSAPRPAQSVEVLSEGPFELVNTQRWLNSEPLTIDELTGSGQVVLLDFWTYTCINCINTFPALKAWHESYADSGLTIVGVHTPEFKFERDFSNVAEASSKHGLDYPIVQDNEYSTWRAFDNRYWPTSYLLDSAGRLRHTHIGEGGYAEMESIIRSLLIEAGQDLSEIDVTYGGDQSPV